MERASERRRYIRLLIRWMDRMQAMLVKVLLITVALLVAAQLMLRIPLVREAWNKTDRLEGEPVLRGETKR